MSDSDCVLAQRITGSGRAAVATIKVCGTDASSLVLRYFRPATATNRLKLNNIYFGTWSWKGYAEELVVTRTGADAFEVHCHGGRLAGSMILESLAEAGARIVDSKRLLGNHLDRFSAEAISILPNAKTERVAAILLDQTRQAVTRVLSQISQFIHSSQTEDAIDLLRNVLSFASLGMHISQAFEVVLVGAPNSGKSSLVNAMVGFERAIVFDQPGTTRDLVTTECALQGWPIRFVDTAGIRDTDNRVETMGIEKALRRIEQADLLLQVLDLSTPEVLSSALSSIGEPVAGPRLPASVVRVGTKADLPKRLSVSVDVVTSSVRRSGLGELCEAICSQLVPSVPSPGQAIPVTAWQTDMLRKLLSLLEANSDREALELIGMVSKAPDSE